MCAMEDKGRLENGTTKPTTTASRIERGRNDICPYGSGKKYKRCCLDHPVAAHNSPPLAAAA
jgi:uncharacterized protein YecA (UPF0149 family)